MYFLADFEREMARISVCTTLHADMLRQHIALTCFQVLPLPPLIGPRQTLICLFPGTIPSTSGMAAISQPVYGILLLVFTVTSDPLVGLCLGSYGGPREVGCFL